MEEVWKPVKGYEGLYDISNEGQYYSYPRPYCKGGYNWGNEDNNGYLIVGLSNKNIIKHKRIHRLVWETFMGEIPKGYDVHHINHNRQDNRLENLKLINKIEHCKTHFKEKKEKFINNAIKTNSKPVLQFMLKGTFVAEYKNSYEAERQTGITQGNICKCCLGQRKSAGGFIWKYKEVA